MALKGIIEGVFDFVCNIIVYWFIKAFLSREVIADKEIYIPMIRFCWRKWQRTGEV